MGFRCGHGRQQAMGVMAKSRVSMAAVRNTEVRDALGAIVEEEGMDSEG